MPPTQPVTLDDFSGGFTDNYLGGNPNKYERADNFYLTSNKKLRGRDGSVIIDATNYQLPDGAVRLGTLIPYNRNDTLFWHYARKLYYGTSITNLTGPSGNQAFDLFTTADYLNVGQWKNQIFLTPSSGTLTNACYPVRVYKDENGAWQLRTAGLPALDTSVANYVEATVLAEMITLANTVREKMLDHFGGDLASTIAILNAAKVQLNAHFADLTRHGSAQAAVATADATDAATAVTLANALYTAWLTHNDDAALGAAWVYHYSQEAAALLRERLTATGVGSARNIAYYLQSTFNAHDSDNVTHAGAATHQMAGAFDDATGVLRGFQHNEVATAELAILTAPVASDYATLVTLVTQMLQAYQLHYADSKNVWPTTHYLGDPYGAASFIRSYENDTADPDLEDTVLESTEAPDDYPSLAARLNDLRVKFAVHAGVQSIHGSIPDWTNIPGVNLAGTAYTATAPTVKGVVDGPYIERDLTAFYRLANLLKNKMPVHMSREGAAIYEHTDVATADRYLAISAADATTDETLGDLLENLRATYYSHVIGTHSGYHHATASADAPTNAVTPYLGIYLENNYMGDAQPYVLNRIAQYLNQTRTLYNTHIAKSAAHGTFVSHATADAVVGDDLELGSYIWALHYEYTYFVGSIEYVDRGPITLLYADQIPTIEVQAAKIMAIPTLANGTTKNYDTANLKIKIARSPKNGIALYYCGEISNGTATFTDAMTDAELITKEPLYTEGGIVENDPPPMAKAFHIVEDTAYYGNVVVGTEYLPNRVLQSHKGDPDSVPATFYVDLDYAVTLISSAKSKPVAVTTAKVYRLDGAFDERGQGEIIAEKIGDVGSDCPQSAVQAADGVFFLGTDGVYYTNGYEVTRINEDWTATYQGWISSQTKRDRIQGVYDDVNQWVYWTVQTDSANSENDSILLLDLRWGIRPDSTFLTWSNGVDFKPTALCIFNRQLLRGDSRGYVFKHGSTYTSDPKVNTGANPSTWAKKAITWDYISGGADFGNSKVRKFIPSATVVAKNHGNLSLQVVGYNDDKAVGKNLAPIRYRSQYTGLIREERTMPAGSLRCSYKQLQLTNANVIITNSDTLGNASVNKVTKTVTLDSAVTQDWPEDAIDWTIYFAMKDVGAGNVADDYTTGYAVTVRTADTLTFTDGSNTCPSGSVEWILKGTPKDEKFELQSITVDVQLLGGNNQMAAQSSETGSNA